MTMRLNRTRYLLDLDENGGARKYCLDVAVPARGMIGWMARHRLVEVDGSTVRITARGRESLAVAVREHARHGRSDLGRRPSTFIPYGGWWRLP